MHDSLRHLARPFTNAFWSARGLNSFVYNASLLRRVKLPDIPVRPAEHYGQLGEDLIVAALLRGRAAVRGLDLAAERYLEIGGNHPYATSATYLVSKQFGMCGVIVEANPNLIDDLRKGRPADTVIHAAVHASDAPTVTLSIATLSEISSLNASFIPRWNEGAAQKKDVVEVPAVRINTVLAENFAARPPAFMSIDVEGLDFDLLQDLDLARWRPWFLQAEPSDDYFPGATQRMIEHMRRFGYALAAKTEVNLIFEERDSAPPATSTVPESGSAS